MKLSVYNANTYKSPLEALECGALYEQKSNWSYGDQTAIGDLLEILDALNICHNGQSLREEAEFAIAVLSNNVWVPLDQHLSGD